MEVSKPKPGLSFGTSSTGNMALAMNFISSVNLNPCCSRMLDDKKLRDNSKPGTKKTCPECKCVNALIGGSWIRPIEDNPQFNRFPSDQERDTQGLTMPNDPQVEEFEAGAATRVAADTVIDSGGSADQS